jgi:hypothetical protein
MHHSLPPAAHTGGEENFVEKINLILGFVIIAPTQPIQL